MALTVITPIFEDAEAASRLFQELNSALGEATFIVAIDDGSIRQPVDPQWIANAGLEGVVLRLKRNVGHQRAIAVGLAYTAETMPNASCIVMDSDGEDVPATIGALTDELAKSSIDVVVAQRRKRAESLRFKLFYVIYKVLFLTLTGRGISFGNFMALKPIAVKRLAVMQETGIHVAGSVLLSKLRYVVCPINRGPRYAGKSKMNFSGLVLHGFRALMIFAEDVLVRTGLASIAIAVASVLAIFASIVLKTYGLATPGWFSVAVGILGLVLLQISAISLMTLMLTGVMRGGSPIAHDYRVLIDSVIEAGKHSADETEQRA